MMVWHPVQVFFLREMLTSYRSAKVLSLESFPLYGHTNQTLFQVSLLLV